MIVCVCQRVSDRDIQRHAQAGCSSFDDLQFETGVSTCCGRCHDCAKAEFHRARHAVAPSNEIAVAAPMSMPVFA